jgi:protease-4
LSEKKRRWWIWIIVFFLIFLFGLYAIAIILLLGERPTFFGEARGIALIRIEGTISADRSGSSVNPEDIIEQLRRADKDDSVKAILLRINSPGGTAAASQEIYREVKRVKKPVVVSIADVGASGAYWVACGADRIVASPASDVGSIGVILIIPNLKELFEKVGIEYVVVSKGKYKDLGNPARRLTEEERKILDAQAEIVYEQFIDAVAENRKLSESEVKELATGLAFLGTEAKEKGLVDDLGNFRDAVKIAARLGKIKGEPEIIEYRKPTIFEGLRYLLEGKNPLLPEGIFSPQIR